VAGYCVVNDLSEREYQLERGGQWDKGKGCDTFGPIGPWLVTADEVPDPQNLDMWLEVNGRASRAAARAPWCSAWPTWSATSAAS
jgi:2,4-diketo-3-deoxy-L-fuconate hydrolase